MNLLITIINAWLYLDFIYKRLRYSSYIRSNTLPGCTIQSPLLVNVTVTS